MNPEKKLRNSNLIEGHHIQHIHAFRATPIAGSIVCDREEMKPGGEAKLYKDGENRERGRRDEYNFLAPGRDSWFERTRIRGDKFERRTHVEE